MNIKIKKILSIIIIMAITFVVLAINTKVNATETNMSISYNTHIQYMGWESDYSKSNGQTSGTSGQSLRLEGIKIKLNNAPAGVTLKYQVHVQNEGWQTWKSGGQTAGTSGKGYRLEAIKIKLEGTKGYKVQYRVHVQNIGWQEWKEDGDIAGTSGQSLRLEAIQIRIVKVDTPTVEYNSHVAMNGWETSYSRSNGQVSGTTGKDLGMQAIKIKLSGVPTNANIQYQTHVQYQGWKNWTSEGNVGGTTGLGLNIEAIKIKINNLSGYSIQYRAHVQYVGWQNWVKDGEVAGTTGKGLRIEAIQIKLVRQDTTKPVISLNGNPKVTVNLGDKYIDAGATATDNVDGNITSKIIVTNNVNTLKVGTYKVTYKVTDKSGNTGIKERTVEVKDYMTSLEVTTPTKTVYNYGEELNLKGIAVKQVMKSGTKNVIDISKCEVTGYNKNKLGKQTITVKYLGKTDTFIVEVKDYMTSLEVTTPTKTLYNYGEELSLTGVTVKQVMKSGKENTININDCEVTGYNKNKLGKQTITVSYGGKTAIFNVEVRNYIIGIEVSTKPTKLEYIEGENVNIDGMLVKSINADNSKEIISIDNLVLEPSENVLFGTTKVDVKYTTTNTSDNTSKTFTTSFDITVEKRLSSLNINKELDNGYKYEQFTLGTISSGADEESLIGKTIKCKVENSLGQDITLDEVNGKKIVEVVFVEELGQMQIKITASQVGIYKIIPYMGNSIGDVNAIVGEEQTITITDNLEVKSAELVKENEETSFKVRINNQIKRNIEFKNIYDDVIDVEAQDISVTGTGLEIKLLNNNIEIVDQNKNVTGLEIKGIAVGNTTIVITVNKGKSTEKVINIPIEVLPKAEKLIDIGNITDITLLQQEPLEEQDNVVVIGSGEDKVIYALIPIKLVDEDGIETKIKGNELVVGDATADTPFSVKYTGYSADELFPLIDVQMFKNKGIITSSQDADSIGIALSYGTTSSELEGKTITLTYGTSTKILNVTVEELRISRLNINIENENIYSHEKTTLGTISSNIGEKELTISDLKYKVENNEGTDITNLKVNGKKVINVTFESEVARPAEILIKVESEQAGTYKIIPYVEVNGNQIKAEKTIAITSNPTVKSAELVKENEEASFKVRINNQIKRNVEFKNIYDDAIDVEAQDISVTGTGLEIKLLNNNIEIVDQNKNVTGLEIKGIAVGNTTIVITVNKGKSTEKVINIPIEVLPKAEKLIDIGNITDITLLQQEPLEEQDNVVVIGSGEDKVIYALIPIKLVDEDGIETKIKGNELVVGDATADTPFSVKYTGYSADELFPLIDVQMFKNKGIITSSQDADSIGIAISYGTLPSELEGKTITLTYGTSTKTLNILF